MNDRIRNNASIDDWIDVYEKTTYSKFDFGDSTTSENFFPDFFRKPEWETISSLLDKKIRVTLKKGHEPEYYDGTLISIGKEGVVLHATSSDKKHHVLWRKIWLMKRYGDGLGVTFEKFEFGHCLYDDHPLGRMTTEMRDDGSCNLWHYCPICKIKWLVAFSFGCDNPYGQEFLKQYEDFSEFDIAGGFDKMKSRYNREGGNSK